MGKVIFWINMVIGLILLSISVFFGIAVIVVMFGNTSVFGINERIFALYITGSDAPSAIPIFIGLLSLSGALILNQCLKSIRKY